MKYPAQLEVSLSQKLGPGYAAQPHVVANYIVDPTGLIIIGADDINSMLTGTIPDSRLSENVALLSGSPVFAGDVVGNGISLDEVNTLAQTAASDAFSAIGFAGNAQSTADNAKITADDAASIASNADSLAQSAITAIQNQMIYTNSSDPGSGNMAEREFETDGSFLYFNMGGQEYKIACLPR